MEHFITDVSEQQIRQEKDKAREIRKSRWWSDRLARGTCHYCGGRFTAAELTMDHIVPIVRGGRSTRGNLVPACKDCNNRKKYLLPIEWEEYLGNLEKETR